MNDPLANPFRKKTDDDAPPPRRAPDGTPREMVKLYIMALVFFMAVGTMIYMWKTVTSAPPKKAKAQGVGLRSDGTRTAPDGLPRPEDPPLPPVKKEVALQDLPKDGVVDFKKLAEPFVDGIAAPVKETPEFVAVLRTMLTAVTPEALAQRVSPGLTADRAYLDAPKVRGEVLRTYGRLIKIYTEPLDTTIPEKVEHVYLGIMMEYPSNRTVWFYLPKKPLDAAGQPLKFKTYSKRGEEFYEDWVEIEGVVLRRYDYPSQYESAPDESTWAKALILFSNGVRIVPKPHMTSTKTGFVSVVVILTAVVIAIVLTAGIMTRKYGGGDASMRMSVIAAKRAKEKAAAAAKVDVPAAANPGAAKDVPPPP